MSALADVSLLGINMLLYNSFRVILVLVVLRTTDSARKIKDGHKVDTKMNYMVYITKAQQSPTFYDAWVCGGAIVTSLFIVTSAACVEDVQYMYAIAGYDKYVNAKDIATNECTRASRKKIIYTCVPKSYDFAYEKIQKWAFIDIAAVKVESPYDFAAAKPLSGCSWVPGKIEINYDVKRQAPDTDSMVLGWGHTHKWRKPGDSKDYNHETLQYSSILLMDKEECKKLYASTPDLLSVIDKYMICAMNEGNINEKGDLITKSQPNADGCVGKAVRVGEECRGPVQETLKPEQDKRPTEQPQPYRPTQRPQPYRPTQRPQPYRPTQRPQPYRPIQRPQPYRPIQSPQPFLWSSYPNANPDAYIIRQQQNQGYNNWNSRGYQNYGFDPYANVNQNPSAVDNGAFRRQDGNMTANTTTYNYTRKAGICQNDHGGPLVTWVGTHEVLLGVASVFQLNKDLDCVGPYLFTSTQCNGAFLDCVINSGMDDIETPTESTTTESKTPESTNPKDPNPESTTPESTTPESTTPESTTPKSTTPESTTPESTTPKSTTPESTTSESTTPESTTPESSNPETTTPGKLPPNNESKKDDVRSITYDTDYYDLYESDDELRPPLFKETLPNPNKKDNVEKLSGKPYRDETFRSYIRRSSDYCNLPNDENRFDVIERRISWRNHPDGPAANEFLEDLFERPSRPIREL